MRIDPRAGSGDLHPLLIRRGVKGAELATLTYGDISITGNGPEGCPVAVGVEIKKLPDLVQCIDNGRFVGHQLPGMLECYDQIWLLVEGIWREDSQGTVSCPRGATWKPLIAGTGHFSASALNGFLLTVQIKLGVRVMFTGTRQQTVDWLYQLNRWWTGKEYEDHRAHLAFDNSAALTLVSRPSLVRRMAKELPGIGWGRSAAVARRFPSVFEMCMADEPEWAAIDGIGKITAKRVTEAINGSK